MTEKQKKFLDFIHQFTDINGYPPSMREIAKGVGVSSPATVKGMIDRLISKGLLKQNALKARSLEIIGKSAGIPLLGSIKAGQPVLSEEHIEGAINLNNSLKSKDDVFFLRISGDSMKDKGILDGDLVMIKQIKLLSEGDVGAFRLNGEVTLKTFHQTASQIILLPENNAYDPIPVSTDDDFEIIGKLVSLIRDMENVLVIES